MISNSCLLSVTLSAAMTCVIMLIQSPDDQMHGAESRAAIKAAEANAEVEIRGSGTTSVTLDDQEWEKFRPFSMLEDYELESIEITFDPKGIELYDIRYKTVLRHGLPSTKVIVTKAKDVRIGFDRFDGHSCLRHVYLKGIRGGTSIILLGQISFKTSKGDFKIWITDLGFSVSIAAGFEDLFYAPAGAQFLSMHCRSIHDWPMPDRLIDALSGAEFVNHTRQLFHNSTWSVDSDPR